MFYTGKGDRGDTSLFGANTRISKSDSTFEALGTLDEANSYIGLCRAELDKDYTYGTENNKKNVRELLFDVQNTLFSIQAEIAGAETQIADTKTEEIEEVINVIEKIVPTINSFTISGGSKQSALFDVARTLVRKAERRIVSLYEKDTTSVSMKSHAYINRLSSLLYALARLTDFDLGSKREAPTYSKK